jgi:deferrochelatase/peroxidase EfeB
MSTMPFRKSSSVFFCWDGVQKRLNGEALEEYVKPIGGGYFFVLPGVVDEKHYLGESLLQA